MRTSSICRRKASFSAGGVAPGLALKYLHGLFQFRQSNDLIVDLGHDFINDFGGNKVGEEDCQKGKNQICVLLFSWECFLGSRTELRARGISFPNNKKINFFQELFQTDQGGAIFLEAHPQLVVRGQLVSPGPFKNLGHQPFLVNMVARQQK